MIHALERHKTINERFTDVADRISTFLGDWKFSIISLFLLGLWTIYGVFVISGQTADWFTSQQWNFPLNTITTVGEWFIGALVAAAANRVERHGRSQTDRIEHLVEHSESLEEQIVATESRILDKVQALSDQLAKIQGQTFVFPNAPAAPAPQVYPTPLTNGTWINTNAATNTASTVDPSTFTVKLG